MCRILVVEDSPTQAAETAFILEDAGFRADCAADGVHALRVTAESRPDLVLVDVLMPGISGFELCKKLKQQPCTQTIPVLLLTTLNSAADVLRGLECGADGYLNKPCAPDALVARVSEYLSANPRGEPSVPSGCVEVAFEGQRFCLPSDPRRILDYLLPVLAYLAEKREEEDEGKPNGREALRRSEERFALAAAGANDGLWDWDLTHNEMYVSPRFKEIAGIPREDKTANPDVWLRRVHADDVGRVKHNLEEHIEGLSAQVHNEHRLVMPDEACRWVLLRGCSVRDANGRAYRMAGSLTDITAQKQAQEELIASREDLQLLARRLFAILEDERTMTAHALHARIGQHLASAQGSLASLLRKLPPENEPLCKVARQATKWVDGAMQNVLKIATDLRSTVMGAQGLASGVRSLVVAFHRRTGIDCRLMLPPPDLTIDLPRTTTVFRILQEALTNVATHAHATTVQVRVAVENGDLVLEVTDNGIGLDTATASRSLGLLGIRERARQWGGDVEIAGEPGKRTILIARIPLVDQAVIG